MLALTYMSLEVAAPAVQAAPFVLPAPLCPMQFPKMVNPMASESVVQLGPTPPFARLKLSL